MTLAHPHPHVNTPEMTPRQRAAQRGGQVGGLLRAAYAPSRSGMTEAARDKQWQDLLDDISNKTGITDPAELTRRAELARKAKMRQLSLKAAEARRLNAQARALEAELDATGLDAGSDGIDLDG